MCLPYHGRASSGNGRAGPVAQARGQSQGEADDLMGKPNLLQGATHDLMVPHLVPPGGGRRPRSADAWSLSTCGQRTRGESANCGHAALIIPLMHAGQVFAGRQAVGVETCASYPLRQENKVQQARPGTRKYGQVSMRWRKLNA